MATYTVYASETIYESCRVEADSAEEAIRLIAEDDGEGETEFNWEIYDADDFIIDCAELEISGKFPRSKIDK